MSASNAFGQLSRAMQRWIWDQSWSELRDIQELAVAPILAREDVIVSAATASGKTEAAFLPILTAVEPVARTELAVLCISPLKALINDQEIRIRSMCERIEAEVTPWHGDVAASRKAKLRRNPAGVLLITPESLEAMFVLRGSSVPGMFQNLQFVVVDELHAFIGNERGRQLQSLLNRVELATGNRIPRIGLSATIGDLPLAAQFLRPEEPESVRLIASDAAYRPVQLQLRGYEIDEPDDPTEAAAQQDPIVRDLYEIHKGATNLIFANAKTNVERYADALTRRCEAERRPNEFFAHHGNLSKELREDAEERLKSGRPTTAIATSTLELGIDIGAVDAVAQIGVPPTVSSLKQRLGRSGRRGDIPSVVRIFVAEEALRPDSDLRTELRADLVQATATVELLIRRWIEPPHAGALHLSTLVQQILSLIAEHGGTNAAKAYHALCITGPFDAADRELFISVLRDLGSAGLIEQMSDGTLVLGPQGERIVERFDFYAAFTTAAEWRLVTGTRSLGTLPISFPLIVGNYLIFGGRRWEIEAVDNSRWEVHLEPAGGGRAPRFGGEPLPVHDELIEEMHRIYLDEVEPRYLDPTALRLLRQGRAGFERYQLRTRRAFAAGRTAILFPWRGDRVMNALLLHFRARQIKAMRTNIYLALPSTTLPELQRVLDQIATAGSLDPMPFLPFVENLVQEKHHPHLAPERLMADFASSQLDLPGANAAAAELADSLRATILLDRALPNRG
ncbi:MAG TPA: DEAD/DEAH box helicase [Thermomicrobiales bacterium]|nr:DEAD/DEAH box helicase [Thermomicrobiales bacterium]